MAKAIRVDQQSLNREAHATQGIQATNCVTR